MSDVKPLWFSEKHALLATRHGDTYSIINGAWDWTAKDYPDIPIDDWKNYTREEFNQLYPDFGY